jgi:hypothetical protein
MPDHPVLGYRLEALATFELRDLRRDLDDALSQRPAGDPERGILQDRLRAVIAEQEERARFRRGR